jgi:hypothetical protein
LYEPQIDNFFIFTKSAGSARWPLDLAVNKLRRGTRDDRQLAVCSNMLTRAVATSVVPERRHFGK